MSPATKRKSPKPPPKSYHHGNLRETLLLAAEASLAERGVQGTTLRDWPKRRGFPTPRRTTTLPA